MSWRSTNAEEAKLADREEKENGYLESCYDIDVEAANGEEYSEWEEKGYSSVMKAPLSTFSLSRNKQAKRSLGLEHRFQRQPPPKAVLKIVFGVLDLEIDVGIPNIAITDHGGTKPLF